MKEAWHRLWISRSPQERRLMAVVMVVLGIALYAWLLQSTTRARQQLLPAVAQLRAQAIVQGAQADEIMRLRVMPTPPPSTTALRQLVQHQVDSRGLTRSLVSIELVDPTHVKLVFGSVAFADWLAWADSVRAQHLRFAAVRIESQATPGQMSVSATLERPFR